MFRIGVMPTQSAETRTLLASTAEWIRFQAYLREQRQGVLAARIVVDTTKTANRVELPTEVAHELLAAAGIAY